MTQIADARWQFTDPSVPETYTFRINPNQAGNPYTNKEFGRSSGHNGQVSLFSVTPKTPREWTFGGVIRDQDQHDELDRWAKKRKVVRIRTHQSHIFEVVIQSYTPIDRQPTPTVPWRFHYTMTCLVLAQVS